MTKETVLATGLRFPEGPAFDRSGQLFVVELSAGAVTRVFDGGQLEVVAEMGGSPNGLAFGPDGNGYVCNGGGRWVPETSTGGKAGPADAPSLIQRLAPDGSFETLISEIDGVPLNSPNDICFDDHSGFYFTDPVWPDLDKPVSLEGIPVGTICYSTTSGEAVRCHTGLRYPNGLGVTDDSSSLIVCESARSALVIFPILAPGQLGEPEDFAFLETGVPPDGMCFDSVGRVIVAGHGSGQLYVFGPDGGSPEAILDLEDKDVTNACFGGPEFSTLFVTESDRGRVVTLDWEVPGMKLFPDR